MNYVKLVNLKADESSFSIPQRVNAETNETEDFRCKMQEATSKSAECVSPVTPAAETRDINSVKQKLCITAANRLEHAIFLLVLLSLLTVALQSAMLCIILKQSSAENNKTPQNNSPEKPNQSQCYNPVHLQEVANIVSELQKIKQIALDSNIYQERLLANMSALLLSKIAIIYQQQQNLSLVVMKIPGTFVMQQDTATMISERTQTAIENLNTSMWNVSANVVAVAEAVTVLSSIVKTYQTQFSVMHNQTKTAVDQISVEVRNLSATVTKLTETVNSHKETWVTQQNEVAAISEKTHAAINKLNDTMQNISADVSRVAERVTVQNSTVKLQQSKSEALHEQTKAAVDKLNITVLSTQSELSVISQHTQTEIYQLNATVQTISAEIVNLAPVIISMNKTITALKVKQCSGGRYRMHREKCYYFSSASLNWTAASSYCTAIGGHLVTITDIDENNYIFQTARSLGMRLNHDFFGPWIGLTFQSLIDSSGRCNQGNSVWTWVGNNQTANYTNWGTNEPNGCDRERCVHFMNSQKWNDERCGSLIDFICESHWFT